MLVCYIVPHNGVQLYPYQCKP